MEAITVSIDAAKFDQAVHHPDALKEGGDMAFFIKPGAMESGKAGFVVTFTVQLPDGSRAIAQAVNSFKNLKSLAAVIRAWDETGTVEPHNMN